MGNGRTSPSPEVEPSQTFEAHFPSALIADSLDYIFLGGRRKRHIFVRLNPVHPDPFYIFEGIS